MSCETDIAADTDVHVGSRPVQFNAERLLAARLWSVPAGARGGPRLTNG